MFNDHVPSVMVNYRTRHEAEKVTYPPPTPSSDQSPITILLPVMSSLSPPSSSQFPSSVISSLYRCFFPTMSCKNTTKNASPTRLLVNVASYMCLFCSSFNLRHITLERCHFKCCVKNTEKNLVIKFTVPRTVALKFRVIGHYTNDVIFIGHCRGKPIQQPIKRSNLRLSFV